MNVTMVPLFSFERDLICKEKVCMAKGIKGYIKGRAQIKGPL